MGLSKGESAVYIAAAIYEHSLWAKSAYDYFAIPVRKCWYGEPQCWKGWINLFIMVLVLRFSRRSK